MEKKTIRIQCRDSARTVPVVWAGKFLGVHRPIQNGEPSTAPRCWTITHKPTGLALVSSLTVGKPDAVALAKAWDDAAGLIDPAKPSAWRFLQAWRDDLQRVGIVSVWGPRDLPVSEREAVWRAMGYEPAADDDAAEPFPVEDVLPANRLRNDEQGWPEVLWRGTWWPAPTFGDVEAWALDSVAETPDGRSVEPDHPEAWTRILAVV